MLVEPLLPPARVGPRGGRREKHPRRRIVDAIFYVVRTGCPWRQLPKDFPPWPTAYWYFSWWHDDGTVEHVHDVLRGRVREADGRKAEPSAGLIDSQSVRTADTVPAATRGFDAGKKVKGRKRFLVTDTLGLLVAIHVVAASVQDRDGAKRPLLWTRLDHPQIRKIWADHASLAAWLTGPPRCSAASWTSSAKILASAASRSSPSAGRSNAPSRGYCSRSPRQGLRDQPGPFRDHDPLGNDRPHGPPPHPRPTGDTAGPAPACAKGFIGTPVRPPMGNIPRQRATESRTAQPSVAGQVAGRFNSETSARSSRPSPEDSVQTAGFLVRTADSRSPSYMSPAAIGLSRSTLRASGRR